MTFEQAMHLVEGTYSFPADPADFHARRTEWLFRASGLSERLASVPVAVLTGSCGKGSTSAFLAHILEELHGSLGLGTKPPLLETPDGNRERYQVLRGGGPGWIEPEHFARLASRLQPFLGQLPAGMGEWAPYDLRYFVLGELFTELDLAVLEANIGLMRDPASVFPNRAVTVLTPIGSDHSGLLLAPEPLPELLSGIEVGAGPLWHKAGGIRGGEPVVLGRQTPRVEEAILTIAQERGAGRIYRYGREGRVLSLQCGLQGSSAVLLVGPHELEVELQTVGDYQAENAVTAALAALALVDRGVVRGDLARAVQRGIARTVTPGRLQIVCRSPLCYYTVASSQTKLASLLASLDTMMSESQRVVVCATFLDRIFGVQEVVERLAAWSRLSCLVLTAHPWADDSRDVPPEQAAAWAREQRPGLEVLVVEEVGEAARTALGKGDLVLLLGNGMAYGLKSLTSSSA